MVYDHYSRLKGLFWAIQVPHFQTHPYHIVSIKKHLHIVPVVPHKAVAEVSKIGAYRRDWLL